MLHHDRKAGRQRAAGGGAECNGKRPRRANQSALGHGHCERSSFSHRDTHDAPQPAAPARAARGKTPTRHLGSNCAYRIGEAMSTAQEIMTTVGERLAANKQAASEIGATYKFVLEGEGGGTWIMNLKGDATLTPGDGPSDCTLAMSAENGVALFEGKVTGEQLFFGNQLRVEGDMSLALRLQSLLAIVR